MIKNIKPKVDRPIIKNEHRMGKYKNNIVGLPKALGSMLNSRSDIYAMGETLYHQLITGRLPFEGDVRSVVAQKIAGRQPSLTLLENQVPADPVHLITTMMASEPDSPPAAMKTVGQALKRIGEIRV